MAPLKALFLGLIRFLTWEGFDKSGAIGNFFSGKCDEVRIKTSKRACNL